MSPHLVNDTFKGLITCLADGTDVLEHLHVFIPCNLGSDRRRNAGRWRFIGFDWWHLTVSFKVRGWRRGNIAPACEKRRAGFKWTLHAVFDGNRRLRRWRRHYKMYLPNLWSRRTSTSRRLWRTHTKMCGQNLWCFVAPPLRRQPAAGVRGVLSCGGC